MRCVLQRVARSSVTVDGRLVAAVGTGLAVLIGVERTDTAADAAALARKIARLRVFGDRDGRMNLSVSDVGGEVLVVSQFTLVADTRRGRRPSFTAAAKPEEARPLVERVAADLEAIGLPVVRGVFGAQMEVEIVNDGPVTVILETAGGRIV